MVFYTMQSSNRMPRLCAVNNELQKCTLELRMLHAGAPVVAVAKPAVVKLSALEFIDNVFVKFGEMRANYGYSSTGYRYIYNVQRALTDIQTFIKKHLHEATPVSSSVRTYQTGNVRFILKVIQQLWVINAVQTNIQPASEALIFSELIAEAVLKLNVLGREFA